MNEFLYWYETHLHTAQASACASTSGFDYIAMYLKLGYTGIIVTDHFYHGNTVIPRNQPWRVWVDQFCRGYEIAKAEGDKQGLQVFFGWEENFDGDEYLIYGLDKQWLYDHPEMIDWSQKDQYEAIHKAGGLVVQAHPFRERNYLNSIHLHPYQVDAMEVVNAGNSQEMDALAYRYASNNKLPMTSGSDMHYLTRDSSSVCGIAFQEKLHSVKDYVTRIKSGEGYQFLMPKDRLEWNLKYQPHLQVISYDKDNKRMDY